MNTEKKFFVFYFLIVSGYGYVWNYQEQSKWPSKSNSCGSGRQSPININSNRIRINPSLRLLLNSYNKPKRNILLSNNGHTAQITLNSKDLKISGSAVGSQNTYVFENMHFHWGDDNFEGTEHSIDNIFGSSEIHFVHSNQKYDSFTAASDKKDGIVVMSVLLRLSRENNRALNPIIRVLPEIRKQNTTAIIRSLDFGRLLPKDRHSFYKYSGSLTTPPCSQPVTFIIFADTIEISPSQLSQFRLLSQKSKSGTNERIISNRRDLQELNGKIVEFSAPERRNLFYRFY